MGEVEMVEGVLVLSVLCQGSQFLSVLVRFVRVSHDRLSLIHRFGLLECA